MAGENDVFDVSARTAGDLGMRARVLPCVGPEVGRGLAVYRGRQLKDPSATVRTVGRGQSGADNTLEVRAADGSVYGMLVPQADGSFVLAKDGQDLFAIVGDDQDMQLDLISPDGTLLARVTDGMTAVSVGASSGAEPQQPRPEEHVQFAVQPGTDPVLVVAAVLSILLFGLEADSPSES